MSTEPTEYRIRDYKTRSVVLSERIARRTVEILERNGGRYDREKLFRELMTMVPPGVAVRQNERDRNLSGKYRANAPKTRKQPISHADAVKFGARSIVRTALNAGRHDKDNPWLFREGDEYVYVRPPKIVVSDRRAGMILMPVLNALASTFKADGNSAAWGEVQLMAHEHGLHLMTCPRNCKLVTVGEVGDLNE